MSTRAFASALVLFWAGIAYPQSAPFTCVPAAVNPVVRSEGIAEPLGDIVLNCSGGAPGVTLTFNLAVFLNVNVTNRVTSAGVVDVSLTINTGSGPVPAAVPALLQTSNSFSFNGLSFTIPPSGGVSLRLTNLHGNVSQLGPGSRQPVQAILSVTGVPSGVFVNSSPNASPLSVGVPSQGLLATLSDVGIRCTGSPLPTTITFSNLLAAGTRFVSTRVTEGFATAFEKKAAGADNGVRIVARYAGLPPGARLFVPDVVAGSDAVQPTAGGDLGGTPSGGAYAPAGAGSLLLVRVNGADSNGAGGTLAFTPGAPGSGTVTFNSVSEIGLNNRAGLAVYEVVDANPAVPESAQFPTFLGLAPITDGSTGPIATEVVSFGPLSNVLTASASDPIPRFIALPTPSDCANLNDCSASYFPSLFVGFARPLDFTAAIGSALQTKTVQIQNSRGGVMSWSATAASITGSGDWLTVNPPTGVNNGTIFVNVLPQKFTAPGVYTATIIIDAGSQAGRRTLPVTVTVTPAPVTTTATPPAPAVVPPAVITSSVKLARLSSAARPDLAAVSPGSLAIVSGSHLKGKDVSVTFDGVAATMLSGDDSTIQVQLPDSLRSPSTVQLQVAVDGDKSAPLSVVISELAPAIFSGGILNPDSSVNTLSNAAAAGSVFQVFSTGLMGAVPGPVTVKLHDRWLTPSWAGLAPGLVGISQVNVDIPADLPAMTTELKVCGFTPSNPEPVCSEPANVTLK